MVFTEVAMVIVSGEVTLGEDTAGGDDVIGGDDKCLALKKMLVVTI